MSRQKVEALRQRLDVFDDSEEIANRLSDIDEYAAQEAAVHIEGLWDIAQQLMKYIEENTHADDEQLDP